MQHLPVLALLASLFARPTQATPQLMDRDSCAADNCYRAVFANNRVGSATASSDCASFLKTTVTAAGTTLSTLVTQTVTAPAVTVQAAAAVVAVTNYVTSYMPIAATVRAAQLVTEAGTVTSIATSYSPVFVTNIATQVVMTTATVVNVVTSYTPLVKTNIITQAVTATNGETDPTTTTITQLATVTATASATVTLKAVPAGPQKRSPQFFNIGQFISSILADLGNNVPKTTTASTSAAAVASTPAYAAACLNNQRYSSVCSCKGVQRTTVTVAARNVIDTGTAVITLTPTVTAAPITSTQYVTLTTVLSTTVMTSVTDVSTTTVFAVVNAVSIIPTTSVINVATTITSTMTQTVASTTVLPSLSTTMSTSTIAQTVFTTGFVTSTITTNSIVTVTTTSTATAQPTIQPIQILYDGGSNDQSALYVDNSVEHGLSLGPNLSGATTFRLDQNSNMIALDSGATGYYLAASGTANDLVLLDNLAADSTRIKLVCQVAYPTGNGGDGMGDIYLGRFSCTGPAGESVFSQCSDGLHLSLAGNVGAGCVTDFALRAWIVVQ